MATPKTPKAPKAPKATIAKAKKETPASSKKRKLTEVMKEEHHAGDAAMEDENAEKPSIFGRPEDDIKVKT